MFWSERRSPTARSVLATSTRVMAGAAAATVGGGALGVANMPWTMKARPTAATSATIRIAMRAGVIENPPSPAAAALERPIDIQAMVRDESAPRSGAFEAWGTHG